jgi:formylglycine-generating enzyme required for sulfatase activity/tRNA A-37 threonylcarbamoyl transferase component Bud32
MSNKTIGKFEILETLGQGGYGIVYRVKDTILNVERALKVLHPVLLADPTFIERFKREAQIMARLDHPHIVPVYDMDQISEHVYISMRYVAGGSLKEILKQEGRLSFDRSLEITKQIASALEYAYQQPEKLIHRDIKPSNILFEKDGSVRLSDFGFAKALSSADSISLSASGGMIGTPNYMAPEIWRGKGATAATDVYSLACVFYEMITGEMLFPGESPPEIMTSHMLDGPQFPEKWKKDIPEGIDDVLRQSMAREAKQRYDSAIIFFDRLERLIEKPLIKAPPVINREIQIIDGCGIPMVLIPAGSFMMGSKDGEKSEKPVHEVWLDDYYMDVYAVTNQSYAQFLNENGNQQEGNFPWFDEKSSYAKIHKKSGHWEVDNGYEDHPVVEVTWYGARAYCEWRGGRLPSEAEWEKAARGGLVGKKYPWGDEKPTCTKGAENGAQYNRCNGQTVAVGSYAPNGYGLYDMAGNVWEWVADWYNKDYYSQALDGNPFGPNTGRYRVLRGGSWDYNMSSLRVDNRNWNYPINAYLCYGFRCAGSP